LRCCHVSISDLVKRGDAINLKNDFRDEKTKQIGELSYFMVSCGIIGSSGQTQTRPSQGVVVGSGVLSPRASFMRAGYQLDGFGNKTRRPIRLIAKNSENRTS
jgi:hypothetical protein